MTLSEFLEQKKERTQLPSKDSKDLSLYAHSSINIEEPQEININSDAHLGTMNLKAIISMIKNKSAVKNFDIVIENPLRDSYLERIGGKGVSKYEPKMTSISLSANGTLLTQTSSAIRQYEQQNIEGSGLAVDMFGGGMSSAIENELGLISNKGTLKAGNTLSDEDKEKFRKVHLRNYWQYKESEAIKPKTGTSSLSSKYADLLNNRLRGATKEQAATGSFLTGYGLTNKEYHELMTNDAISNNIASNKHSLLNPIDAIVYGMESKRDIIIDSGRFSNNINNTSWTDTKSKVLHTNFGNSKGLVIFNISSFAADPAHTPFFRKQILSLGSEVTFNNLFVDQKYVTQNSFDIKLINNDSHMSDNKHARWVWQDSTRGQSAATPIQALMHRYPDFMGNMSYVFFSTPKVGGVSISTDMMDIEPARIVDISVKMPSLKTESIDFVNRTIPVISNAINMNHQGSIKVRIDENLKIWRKMLEASGIILNNQRLVQVSKNPEGYTESIQSLSPVTVLRRSNSANNELEVDLYVGYNLVTNFIPIANYTDPSTPYSKKVINYQHDNTNNLYARYYIFKNIRFLGVPEIEFSKDGSKVELNFDFTFKRIDEEESGLAYSAT
jgi:hypothetical protein